MQALRAAEQRARLREHVLGQVGSVGVVAARDERRTWRPVPQPTSSTRFAPTASPGAARARASRAASRPTQSTNTS